jgi:hypothetical protein
MAFIAIPLFKKVLPLNQGHRALQSPTASTEISEIVSVNLPKRQSP